MALGGSVAFQKKIDTDFLARFHSFILEQINQGRRFVIVVGGGYVARRYQKAASEIAGVKDQDKDWIGIQATRLNAHFLHAIFRAEAHPIVFDERFKLKGFGRYSTIIGSGWKPGWSTDFVAVQIAVDFGLDQVCILGKPDYVYTADSSKDKTAQPLKEVTWQEYLKLIPNDWSPGLHSPVDPVAARLAQDQGLKVIVADGRNLANLRAILNNKPFQGTTLV